MATAAEFAHDDATTVHVEGDAGGRAGPTILPTAPAGLSGRVFDLCECGRELEDDPASRLGFPHWCCKRCGGKNKSHTADCDERHRSNQELQRERTARDRTRTAAAVFGEPQQPAQGVGGVQDGQPIPSALRSSTARSSAINEDQEGGRRHGTGPEIQLAEDCIH